MGPAFKKIFSNGTPADNSVDTPSYPSQTAETPVSYPAAAPAWEPPVAAPSAPAADPYSRPSYSSAKNVLNSDVAVKGSLKFTDDLLIDGIVEGEISSQGILTIGQNAHVTAEINTSSVVIHGKLHGNVNVTDRLELKATAELIGDVKAGTIAIEAGAVFVGRSEVGASASSRAVASARAKAVETPAAEPQQGTLDVTGNAE